MNSILRVLLITMWSSIGVQQGCEMFARATGARVQTQVPHNFCCFDHFERRQQILRHPLLRTTLSRRPASYACSKEAAGQAGRGAEVLKERTRNYYHIEIFFFQVTTTWSHPTGNCTAHSESGNRNRWFTLHSAKVGDGITWAGTAVRTSRRSARALTMCPLFPSFLYTQIRLLPTDYKNTQKKISFNPASCSKM